MQRNSDSHKGENGTVAIVGGSRHQHGAPLFSALAAEAAGVDVVHLFVPVWHEEVSKQTSLNFQVRTFGSREHDAISARDRTTIVELLATIDAVVIGPGLSRAPADLAALFILLEEIPCPMVLDASALQAETLSHLSGRSAVLTPHLGELERMKIERAHIQNIAKEHGCTFLLKSPVDVVVDSSGKTEEISGGNAGLTVGGTGDALAGLVAGLLAQKLSTFDACVLASKTIKRVGEELKKERGFSYTTRDVIEQIPYVLSTF